jgi:aspartate kinase
MTESRRILVQKYGGSSVASVEHIQRVARRVIKQHQEGWSVVVVVSAMGKSTDELVALSRQITSLPQPRETDMLLHAGEIVSSALLAMAIDAEGVPALSFTGSQAGMQTDGSHTQAKIQAVDGTRILEQLDQRRVVVVTGFQGVSPRQEVTTLGRGGSDTSAVAIAVGVGADRCEILTDVDGIYTSDPRVVPAARKLVWCSYDEMLEMAVLGARVLHSRSVEIARRFAVPFQVCTSFNEVPGTWVSTLEIAKKEFGIMEQVLIRGIAHDKNVAKVSIGQVPDRPGIASTIFQNIGEAGINIRMIVQAQSHHGTNDVTFVIEQDDVPRLRSMVDDVVKNVAGKEVLVSEDVGTVSVVGEGVARETGVAARIFDTLGRHDINIDLISTSNLMITCVVPEDRIEDAVRVLHAELLPEGEGS